MDLTGIPPYAAVMKGLLPDLNRSNRGASAYEEGRDFRRPGSIERKGLLSLHPGPSKALGRAFHAVQPRDS